MNEPEPQTTPAILLDRLLNVARLLTLPTSESRSTYTDAHPAAPSETDQQSPPQKHGNDFSC